MPAVADLSDAPVHSPRTVALRILIVLHDFQPGGAERIAIRLASRWASSGAKVTLVCGSPEGALRSLLGDKVDLLTPASAIARSRWSRMVVALFAAQVARDVNPDIIFLPGNSYAGMAPVLKLRLRRRCPILVIKLSNVLRRQGRVRAKRMAFEAGLVAKTAFADHVIAMSPELLRDARKVLPWSDDRFSVLTQPVLDDEPANGPPPKSTGVDSRPLLVAAGRLSPQKNFSGLVQAVSHVALPYRLVIFGEGPERGKLEALVDHLGLSDKVALPGYATNLAKELGEARLFILSSDYEGFPSVVVEALAANVPVVATAGSPAIATLLSDREAGLIVPVGDSDRLAEAIEEALSQERPKSDRLRQSVEAYRISPAAENYLSLFRKLAGSKEPRAD